MEKSINSPISDDYGPKAETAETIKSWITDNSTKSSSGYTFSTFFMSPCIAYVCIVAVVCYYNHLTENYRIKRIKEKLDSTAQVIKANCKYELQNVFLLSLLFVIYTVVLSACAIGYSYNTNKILNEEYTNYYSFHTKGELFFATGLSVSIMVLDGFVFAAFISALIVIMILQKRSSKSNNDEIWFWKFCAYSIIFPLCNLANHFHYIVIAFIHDVYHATGVALVYGILIVILYEALVQLPKIFANCKDLCIKCYTCIKCCKSIKNFGKDNDNENDAGSKTPLTQTCDNNESRQSENTEFYIHILVAKIIVIVILIGYFIYNILIYHYLPINKAFDDATNHLIGLYQAITVFFAAVAAYLIFNKEYTSPISVFTKAEYEHGVLEKNRCKNWENFTAQKRDNIMAKELLELLKNMKPSLDNTQGDNSGGNPEIREIEQS